jgi:hypothetical protein
MDTITFLGPKNMGVDTKLVPLAVAENVKFKISLAAILKNPISQWLILVEFFVRCPEGHTDKIQPKLGCYGKCPG